MGRHNIETCTIDTTPLINSVFLLVIFFAVTLETTNRATQSIRPTPSVRGLARRAGPEAAPFTVEVGRNGRLSVCNLSMDPVSLRRVIKARYDRMGEFAVVIRGDERTSHADIRRVMEICTDVGLHQMWFAAIRPGRR